MFVLDEPRGIPLADVHARPHFRHEQADIVIDAILRTDVGGGADIAGLL